MLMGSSKPNRGPRLEKAKVCNERPAYSTFPALSPPHAFANLHRSSKSGIYISFEMSSASWEEREA
jgi:hypothetical protein